jgi:hypothetical protein
MKAIQLGIYIGYLCHYNISSVSELCPCEASGTVLFSRHIKGKLFSWKGLEIGIKLFLEMGHRAVCFVSHHRVRRLHSQDREIVARLKRKSLVTLTPSRKVGQNLVTSYDDRRVVGLVAVYIVYVYVYVCVCMHAWLCVCVYHGPGYLIQYSGSLRAG